MNEELEMIAPSTAFATITGPVGPHISLDNRNGYNTLKFSIPVTESWEKDGEIKYKQEHYRIEIFGKNGEKLKEKLRPGMFVQASGQQTTYRAFNNNTQQYDCTITIKAQNALILSAVPPVQAQQQQPSGYGQQQGSYQQQGYGQPQGQGYQQQQQGGQAFNNFDIGNLDPDALGPGINLDQQ